MKKVILTYRYKKEGNQYNVVCLDWENLVYTCADTIKDCYLHAIEATQLAIEDYKKGDLLPIQQPKLKSRKILRENEFQITFDFEKAKPLDIKIGQRIKYTKELPDKLQPAFA